MIIADIQLRWIEFLQYILNRRSKRRGSQFTRVNLVRERSISLLQIRYGYTKEKATSELNKYYSKARLY
jgi:hypothetical protein